MRARFVLRVRILSLFAIIGALFLLTRLYLIQIVHGDEYRRQAAGQYMEAEGDEPLRGEILFTKKDGEHPAAAVMQNGWRIAITPKDIQDPQSSYKQLAAAASSLDKDRFLKSAAKTSDPYEEVAFRLNDDEAAAVRNEKLPGVITVRDEWRFYPAGSLAAQTIGFVGYKGDQKEGVYGLEKYWEDTLRQDSDGLYVNPFAEIFSNVTALLSNDPTDQKGSIITSLEPSSQRELETILQGVMSTYSPKLVGGIVMDPKTGEIIAMSDLPSFDLNKYNLVDDAKTFSNQLVEGRFEMGSIMKPLTMAAAIDAGAVSTATTYNDTGCITKTGAKICNFDGKSRGVVNVQEILSQSLNVGASFLADQMGHSKFADYVKKYGMGEETGIDLPGEVPGDISALFAQGAADVDFASASFGQAIAVTPIEMIRALATLANKGKLPEPHVVTAVRSTTGIERKISTADETQVLKPETAETVTNMLVKVYDDALLKGALKQEHYSIAAKTGTAQLGDPVTHKYYTDRYLHSFFGYFPAHDPKFIVFLYAVEPHGVEYASASLANPFDTLARFLINYYDIPPDR
jgi:stage V sporulation protein D (sporulation-specific penicillin-binding protein)